MISQMILAFMSGLTNGGISCTTVQGGLLTTAVAESKSKFRSTSLFLLSKIVSHTILGGLLGIFGGFFTFSLKSQGILQIIVGLFMITTALKIIGVVKNLTLIHFRIPELISSKLNILYLRYPELRSILLGVSTIFIPCGATQAMFVFAIGSGNPINGALIMFSFVLGTTPLFFAIGLTVGNMFKFNLLKNIAVAILIILGISTINNGQVLRGSNHTLQNYSYVLSGGKAGRMAQKIDGYQIINLNATNTGYSMDSNTIKLGVPVKLIIESQNLYSCASTFVIPSLGISESLPVNGQKIIEFTPTKEGLLTFSCGMGMFADKFVVER